MKFAIVLAGILMLMMPTISSYAKGRKMTVHGESLVLATSIPGNLCFDEVVPGSVIVRSTFKPDAPNSVIYKEDIDYTVDHSKGTITRTATSSIPDFSTNVLYGQKNFDHTRFPGYSNHSFFVWVDYTTTNGRPFAKANNQTRFLKAARAKLTAGGPFRIVGYGDSITSGAEASSEETQFTAMYCKYLQAKYPKAKIDFEYAGISGYATGEGIGWWDKYMAGKQADLVLLGWGMNDHNRGNTEPDVYCSNLITLVGMIRGRMTADVIIYSAFPPNHNWYHSTRRMNLYAQSAEQAAKDTKAAYANVYDTWAMVLKRKDQSSLLGNNINHPNDFGHWLYMQALVAISL